MILSHEIVTQVVEGSQRHRFLKEIVQVDGPQPLAMVRKRLPPDAVAGAGYVAPVLLLHGFGQNRYAWHLTGRSFANRLAADGFDVYNLDLRGHGRSRQFGAVRPGSVDDYILEDLPAAHAEVCALSGGARPFLIGHSMGGLIASAAADRLCPQLAGIVAIGTPYRFTRGSFTLGAFARVVDGIGEFGVLRPGTARLPIRFIGRWLHMVRHAWELPSLPLPVRAWTPGAFEPTLLREYLHQSFDSATLGTLLQLTRLAVQGEFRSVDGTVDYGAAFERCDVPLLVIAGMHDLLAPPASVRPLYDRSRAHDKTYRVLPLGHADLLLGREAPARLWPLVSGWMADRSRTSTAAKRRPVSASGGHAGG